MAKDKLESLPQLQVGVSERSNIRMKLMARPICPVATLPELKQHDGSMVPNPKYTGEPNCQMETGNWPGWWDLCADRGHDPYYARTERTVVENETDENGYVIGKRERVIVTRKLNTTRVPIGTRFHSGRGEVLSKGLKGRKTLTEMGFNEKCEFRNCELDAKFLSKYGNFCGERHARLVGADVEGIMLSANIGAKNKQLQDVRTEFEGVFVVQQPPDMDAGF